MAALQPSSAALPIARAIEGFYVKARPFECDFTFETLSTKHDTRASARMHLVFVRPGELQATSSTGEVVTVHNGVLTMADSSRHLVYQQFVPADFAPSALAYTAGFGALSKHLSLAAYAGGAMNAPGLDIVVGTPLHASPDVSKVLLLASGSGDVKRTVIVTPSGSRVRLDAVQCTMNAAPSAGSLLAPVVPRTAPTSPVPPSPMTRALP